MLIHYQGLAIKISNVLYKNILLKMTIYHICGKANKNLNYGLVFLWFM